MPLMVFQIEDLQRITEGHPHCSSHRQKIWYRLDAHADWAVMRVVVLKNNFYKLNTLLNIHPYSSGIITAIFTTIITSTPHPLCVVYQSKQQ